MKTLRVKDMKIIMRNLLFLVAMTGATGLVAMDPNSKRLLERLNRPENLADLITRCCGGEMRVQFGFNLRDPKVTAEIISFCTTRPENEQVPQIEQDTIQILNKRLAQDVFDVMQGGDRYILNRYAHIKAVKSPYAGDTATVSINKMLDFKDGIGTRKFLDEILKFRAPDAVPVIVNSNQSMKFLFCGSIIGLAVLCGIYYAFFTKKTAEETEDEESENDEKKEVINEQV
jgi:hypothetical protein